MRITLDIADDVLRVAKERARREGKSVGRVVSDLAWAGLADRVHRDARDRERSSRLHGFRPFPQRGGSVTNRLIDSLREEDVY